jgi:hypothetical protein
MFCEDEYRLNERMTSMGNLTLNQKPTRARFLLSLGAFSLAALTGCAAGAPPDSIFTGTYLSTYTLPAIGENGTFSFSVERKGKMIGSFTDANNTNLVYAFDGVVENTGKFTGTMRNGTTTSTISGLLVVGGSGGSGGGTGNTGSGGDFNITRGVNQYRGYFTIGGSLASVDSIYKGIYSAVYSVAGLQIEGKDFTGLVSYSVDSKGNMIGSMTRAIQDKTDTGLLTGTVGNSGAFLASVQFSTITLPLEGTLVNTTDGSAQGNYKVTQGGVTYSGKFSKSESVQAGGDSPYQGAYRGTYALSEANTSSPSSSAGESGVISFTVDPSGTIQGFFSQSNNNPVATFLGSFQNDGTFSGSLTYPTGSPAPYDKPRPIVGKMGAAKGANSGTLAGDFTLTVGTKNVPGNFQATIGGSEADSIYRGAYGRSDAPEVSGFSVLNGSVPEATNDGADLTTDKQGEFIGVLAGMTFMGRFTNDGRIVGTLGSYTISGKVARQSISALDPTDSTKRVGKPGIAGTFQLTRGGTTALAAFAVIGGSAEGATPR